MINCLPRRRLGDRPKEEGEEKENEGEGKEEEEEGGFMSDRKVVERGDEKADKVCTTRLYISKIYGWAGYPVTIRSDMTGLSGMTALSGPSLNILLGRSIYSLTPCAW